MSFTLSNLLQEFYVRIGQLVTGYATGGSTTTVLDSTRNGEDSDDDWKRGAVIITQTTDGAAPQGEFGVISTSTGETWTLTLSAALTATVDSGDLYGFVGEEFSLSDSIHIVNSALRRMGYLDLVDNTTLDSVANQSEYSSQATWKRPYGPFRVDIAQNTTSGDKQWVSQVNFDWIPATAGAGGTIIFPDYPKYASRDIRVWFRAPHPMVSTYDDVIDGRLEPETVTQAVVATALDWMNTRIRGGDDFLLRRQNKAETDFVIAKQEHPTMRKGRKSKLFVIGNKEKYYPGDRNPT